MNHRNLPSMAALHCFEAAARHLSFTRAGIELNMTQSAISKQIQQLETLLNTVLFQRIRQRLYLTPAGSVYLSEVRKILNQMLVSTQFMRTNQVQQETLHLNTLPDFGARWLLPRLNGFRFQYPHIRLDISSRAQSFDFRSENIDITFYFGQGIWPDANSIKVMDEAMVAVCTPELLKEHHVETPMDLTHLVLMQNSQRPEAWHDWFSRQNYPTELSYHGPRFDTFEMAVAAAKVGCGVALVPRFLVEEELEDRKLMIPWPFILSSTDSAYYMAYAETQANVEKVRDFLCWIGQYIDTDYQSNGKQTLKTEVFSASDQTD